VIITVKKKVTKELYCQFLIAAQNNFTATNLSDHSDNIAHDSVSRFLSGTNLTPRALWDYAKPLVSLVDGVLILDDTVLDHWYGKDIELVKWQYSGTHHRVIQGIGLINLLWSRNGSDDHIPTDFRLYHPGTDGKTKNAHARDMLTNARQRGFTPKLVTMDCWYASTENLHLINDYNWTFVAGMKSNRVVFVISGGKATKYSASTVPIPKEGVIVRLKEYGMIRLFQLVATNGKVEYIATNNLKYSHTDVRDAYTRRWKIEEFHRGIKQTTGVQMCQSRNSRAQRTHIFCSILSFLAFEKKRLEEGITWYEAKRRIISDSIFRYLKDPFIPLPETSPG
jgi:putative transposase